MTYRTSAMKTMRSDFQILTAEDIEDGDEIQIGSDLWEVRGSLLLWSGQWAFRLQGIGDRNGRASARLLVPAEPPQDGAAPVWTLVRDGNPSPVPAGNLMLLARR